MVAVMRNDIPVDPRFLMTDPQHFRVEWFAGTGNGGQHKNKHQNSCRLIHIPTGIVETRQSRSREANLRDATATIKQTLEERRQAVLHGIQAEDKKLKFGSGQRGDKIITLQFQNDKVTHHLTNKTCRIKDFMNGKMRLLW